MEEKTLYLPTSSLHLPTGKILRLRNMFCYVTNDNPYCNITGSVTNFKLHKSHVQRDWGTIAEKNIIFCLLFPPFRIVESTDLVLTKDD